MTTTAIAGRGGAVRIELAHADPDAGACHCNMCRRRGGGRLLRWRRRGVRPRRAADRWRRVSHGACPHRGAQPLRDVRIIVTDAESQEEPAWA